ncbi:hypothetical protein VNO80_25397 [Phaseolus coccineus]|uniref:Uncharacterized protein n=1 Tax=Phaseolus coccineus TaxID=3886 RepID=A0AAN9LU72_PHACN
MIRLKIGFLLPWHYLSIRCLMNVRAVLLLALLLLSSLPATYPSSLISFSPKVRLAYDQSYSITSEVVYDESER